jgi:hypothetical protein
MTPPTPPTPATTPATAPRKSLVGIAKGMFEMRDDFNAPMELTDARPATTAVEPMTDAELAEIAAREAKATLGPWDDVKQSQWDGQNEARCGARNQWPSLWAYGRDSHANITFASSARTDVPRLLREVARQRTELAAARASLAACRAALDGTEGMLWTLSETLDRDDQALPLRRLVDAKRQAINAALADAERADAEGG